LSVEVIIRVKYRTVLSSERAPHIKKPVVVGQKTKIWSWAPDGCPTSRQTGRLTVGRNLTSTSSQNLCYIGHIGLFVDDPTHLSSTFRQRPKQRRNSRIKRRNDNKNSGRKEVRKTTVKPEERKELNDKGYGE
jgi:hypothetical protein